MQQKKHSVLESLTNVGAGYGVAIISQVIIFPWFGIQVPLRTNLWIGAWFTLISLVRSYVLRRIFTHVTERDDRNSQSINQPT